MEKTDHSQDSKRIAKNTLFLYFRTIITMLISLYTSRVVLEVLGIIDFGIYNIVGGVVIMFSFLSNALAAGTQRFLSFELGKENYSQLKKTFSMLLNIHVLISILIFVLAETLGLWFLNTKLNIPPEKIVAARWIYQFSILSFMLTVLQVPYYASIIAHEKMSMFAYIGVLDASLKLLIVFMLTWINYNKLTLYGFLIFFATVIIFITYMIYCRFNFKECNYKYSWDKKLFKIIFNYSGWNLFGGLSVVAVDQGVNIILNVFFGPAINASRGIAYQVKSAITTFTSNFQTAVNPQIIKSYASDNHAYMMTLLYQSAKHSFYLLFLLSLPVLLETKLILSLWLKIVPDYTVLFCRLILINAWIDCLSGPLVTAVQATGRIKLYQIIVGSLLMLNLPLSYIAIKITMQPEIAFYISIIISLLALIVRITILEKVIEISLNTYFNRVLWRVIAVMILPIVSSYTLLLLLDTSVYRFILVSIFSTLITICSVYFVGLDISEKQFVIKKIKIFCKL